MKGKPGIIACVLLAGGLAGCGGGGAESFLDAQAMAQLHEVLSKEPRLPDGFTVRPQQAWRMPFGQADRNCRALLEPAGGRAPKQALTAQAAVSYHGDGLGEQAGVGLARYANKGAEGHLNDLAKALGSCHAVRTSSGTDLRLQRLAVKDTGDEALGARLRGRLNGYPYAMDVVVTRVGDTLVSVVHTGMNEVDAARTRKVVDAAISMASA
ncbi:hypothetical protein SAMN05444920_101387 [Nonomuraea solani]|uniref:PknH-like extracellular domain-containing protein n=1 Tax=Nonomuraea solani TaxID=1144553 RepID=A0A1H5U4H4_9ACTN|nr:hypothetical protein [Nonomuraea solani]SEF69131.1 hypothetical protein SAMN05444920_101387 [Nonomuraea solani]